MNGSWRTAALVSGLLLALLFALVWYSRKPVSDAPPSIEGPTPAASAVPDRARQLEVQVVFRGQPLADAGVLVQHTKLPRIFSSLRSDARGRVVFADLPVGSYQVTAMHFGYQQKSKEIRLERPRQVLRLALDRAQSTPLPSASVATPQGNVTKLSGRVVNERGEPVPKAQVGASSDAAPVFVEADEQGRFELSTQQAARLNLFATAPGYAAAQLAQVAAGSSDVLMVMSDPASITGTVTVPATVERLFVRLCHHDPEHNRELCIKSKYYSPPTKHYEIDRLPPGNFQLVFSDGEHELGRLPIKIASGEQLVVPDQRL